ncbi:MAG: hypothetical protein JSV66_18230 [Trueperaceae bacterium]|nr:MAG: hypothetical protein JSV66_18230 [Trueperaceae bacterium]
MTIDLTPEQEAQLIRLVQTGVFESVEQFIGYSLAMVGQEDAEHKAWLKAELQKGIASLDAGHFSTMSTEEIAAEGARQLDEHRGG